jgi:hypothetical protein
VHVLRRWASSYYPDGVVADRTGGPLWRGRASLDLDDRAVVASLDPAIVAETSLG